MKKTILIILIAFLTISISQAQSITVTFPNGGEHWIKNTEAEQNITWESSGVTNFLIEFSDDNGSSWSTVEALTTGSSYSWTSPDIISSDCLIKISDAGNVSTNDESDATFLVSDKALYYAQWNTSMGVFRTELRGDYAPRTVQNFINLCEKEFYTDLLFHRVISNFMIQDGCPLGTGYGDPGYSFDDEFHPLLRHSHAGILSMANAGANTNGSQYFITVQATSYLDDAHAVYGRVVDGMDIVYEISEVEVDETNYDRPLVDVDIYSVQIVEETQLLGIVYPADGSSIIEGSTIDLEWESDFVADVKVEFSSDNGDNWQILSDSIPADASSIEWTLPSELSAECLIKVTSLRNPDLFAVNSVPFEIKLKPAKLTRFDLYENVIADASNPNNIVMPNAVVKFRIKIKNDFSESLNATSAILTCENTDLEITQNTVTFNSIESDSEMWSNEVFEISIPEELPETKEYVLTISVSDDNVTDNDWVSFIVLPILEKGNFSHFYDNGTGNSQGNGDGTFEADETIEVELNVANNSSAICYTPHGQLTCSRNFINIWDNVEGNNGMVYDTTVYNGGNPLNPGITTGQPEENFVFDYNSSDLYQITMILELNAYLLEEAGASWDEGGVLVKFGIPWIFNEGQSTFITESENSEVLIYPNPAKEYFTIVFNSQNVEQKQISIFAINGTLIKKEIISNTTNTIQIDSKDFEAGIYILKINCGDKLICEKIIID